MFPLFLEQGVQISVVFRCIHVEKNAGIIHGKSPSVRLVTIAQITQSFSRTQAAENRLGEQGRVPATPKVGRNQDCAGGLTVEPDQSPDGRGADQGHIRQRN